MAHPIVRPLPYLASSPASLEVADDEAADAPAGGGLVAATGVAAPAVSTAKALDACRYVLAPHRVAYTCNLLELAVWAIALVWIGKRVLDGRAGDALNALARTKAPH